MERLTGNDNKFFQDGMDEHKVSAVYFKLKAYEDAEEQGLLVRLDERTALAIAAGARAIENNKRLFGATYMWDIFSKFGEPKEISYCEAAQILREISEPVLVREEAEKALKEAQSSDKG